MKEKILIVDDNKDIISFIKPALEAEGFDVEYATSGVEALHKINEKFNLILLDVMLPECNGFDICRKVRKNISCPIVFLTARGLEEERVKGFLVGGDDYIVKPFSLKELIARIKAHLRRDKRFLPEKDKKQLVFGEITINLVQRSIKLNEIELEFTKKEFDIVEILVTNPGQVFSKEQLFEKVWGYDSDSELTTVTEHMKRIRNKIQAKAHPCDYIKTIWGVGYKWDC